MPSALVPLANLTLSSSASTVTFSSISGSYRDLMLVMTGTTSSSTNNIIVRLNGDTTAGNYINVMMYGNGSSVGSATNNTYGGLLNWYAAFTTNRASIIANFLDYSATDKHKTWIARSDNPSSGLDAIAARWANTAAITTLMVYPNNGGATFDSGSTFALYGVSA